MPITVPSIEDLSSLQSRLAALETWSTNQDQEISALQAKVAGVDVIQEQLAVCASDLSALARAVAAHEQRIAALESPAPPPPPVPPAIQFQASPSTITAGQSVTLSWTVTDATDTSLNGVAVGTSGTLTVFPAVNTTYTLAAIGLGGTTSSAAVVTVNPVPPPPSSDYRYVRPDGNDSNDGKSDSSAGAWKTIQQATTQVQAGQTVLVRPGTYAGFSLVTRTGLPGKPLTFKADPGAVINQPAAITQGQGVESGIAIGWGNNVPSHVVVDGFTLQPAGGGEWYAGIRCAGKQSFRQAGIVLRNNTCAMRPYTAGTSDKYGIYCAWQDGLVEENNVVTGCYNSGIYVANSSRDYIVRGNDVSGCGGNGIHNNGDLSSGSPGINTNALIENNVIRDVGAGIGGQAISCDALQDSRIQNNLIYDAHAKGISLYVQNGAQGSRRCVVVNNTVITAADASGACLRIPGSENSGHTIFNNVFLSKRATVSGDGGYSYAVDEGNQCVFDYNAVTDQVQRQISLASWRGSGRDQHGMAGSASVISSWFTANYHLPPGSPLDGKGAGLLSLIDAPHADKDGVARPSLPAIGCYE